MSDSEITPGSLESVESFYRRLLEPGLGKMCNATHHDCRPDGGAAVVSALVRHDFESLPGSQIHLVDLESGATRPLTGRTQAVEHLARWSPDGEQIAFLSDGGGGPMQPWLAPAEGGGPTTRFELAGHSAEYLEWFPDGRRLLVLAAEEGAAAGVLSGSGTVPAVSGGAAKQSWQPQVYRGATGPGGWRRAFVVDTATGSCRQVSPGGLNVWEGCLAGEAVLAVVSEQPSEGSWVKARVVLIDLDGSAPTELYRPKWQLGSPAASGDGSRMAVLEGVASDRGLVAGEVVLLSAEGEPRRLETGGVDATWIGFRTRERLCLAGVRQNQTVMEEIDLVGGAITVQLEGQHTTTDEFYPRAAIVPGAGLLLTAGGWGSPPQISRAERGSLHPICSLANAGTDWLSSRLGQMEEVSWRAPDGQQISGLLALPRSGSAPHPTVLLVHGGPSWCWRGAWPGLESSNYALLAACGLALFMPNPRGSSGRGQDFLALELGDYGGGEVDDVLSGLDHLVQLGVADGERLGVLGVSHGGYMSCWLTTRTRRFKAAVALSPVTDWYSQHFGSNIPEFDEMYLGGSPLDPGGPYFQRSPVFFAHLSSTPTLLGAGLQDRCTPPGQAEEFHRALLANGTPTDLVVYPEEGHGVRRLAAKIDVGARISGHLARYLLPEGDR